MISVEQRSRGDLLTGIGVHALDEFLQDRRLNTPLSAAANLDGGEFSRAHERVGLRGRDIQRLGNVGKSQETWHGAIVPKAHLLHQWQVAICGQWRTRKGVIR